VLNGAAAQVAVHDKLVTARRLGLAGLPHPRTASVRGSRDVSLAPPLLVKPRFGSWGRDVLLCRDQAELERTLAAVRERPWFRRHCAAASARAATRLRPPTGPRRRRGRRGEQAHRSPRRMAHERLARRQLATGRAAILRAVTGCGRGGGRRRRPRRRRPRSARRRPVRRPGAERRSRIRRALLARRRRRLPRGCARSGPPTPRPIGDRPRPSQWRRGEHDGDYTIGRPPRRFA
jgi:hypothetical protein